MNNSFFEKTMVFLATGFNFSSVPPRIAGWAKSKPWGQKYFRPSWTGAGISGSILGIATYLLLPKWIATSVIALAIGTLFAVYVSHYAEKIMGIHDDSRIVIDEWIGAWIATAGLWHQFGFSTVVAFVLFRIFDVYKGPWGGPLQRLPGGWGVVMDDVVAGLIANFFARIVVVFVGVL